MHPKAPDFDTSKNAYGLSLHNKEEGSHGAIGAPALGAGPSVTEGVFIGSALEVGGSTSSLDLSLAAVPPNTNRVRRRSDLHHIRPSLGTPAAAIDPEAVELSVLDSEQLSPDIPNSSVPFQKATDGVVIGPSLPTSLAPSVRFEEETDSIAPVVSTAEKSRRIRRGRLHFAALCWSFFLEGWNDGSTGPLLPTIQRSYNVGFAIVSLLFVFNCIGFITGGVMNVYLNDRIGFGKVLVIGSILQLCAYAMLAPGGPFPIMCIAFLTAGFGISLQNAQGNGFVGSLQSHSSTKFGFLHASYGLGAFVAPLVATYFSTARHWSFHYLISAGIALSNVSFLFSVFRFRKQEEVLAEAGQVPAEVESTRVNKYRQIMSIKAVHFLSVWALIYIGVEVSLGGKIFLVGWIVTFIEQKRGGGASAGYISSGFFGGLMLGRITLMWLNRKVGERRIMFLYAFLAIQLEITIWVVPSLIENAVAVSFIGLLLGPMYPILMNHCTATFPKWLLTGCVGWVGGIGMAGSAVLPFITGLLASKFGIGSLQPLIVSMMSTMIIIWAIIPRVRRVD